MKKETLIFTPSALLEILSGIEELSDYQIGITETIDGKLQLQVGSSVYELEQESETQTIEVTEDTVDKIEEVNENTYEELTEIDNEPITSGIIGELAKNMLLGGMLRLSGKILKN